ncbi:hypothetical protein ACHAWF_012719 [Thalassiosira exigua]
MYFSQIASWYGACLDDHPLLTKSATTVVIGILGDAAAQVHEGRVRAEEDAAREERKASGKAGFRYDARRGLASVANNVCLTAPVYHFGYEWLESLIPISGAPAALAQVLVDCILFDAAFVFLMYLSSCLIEGRNVRGRDDTPNPEKPSSMKENVLPAILSSWKLSIFIIPVEFVLFRYFPLRLRALGMNFIDLVWEAVVSFALHQKPDSGDGKTAEDVSVGTATADDTTTSAPPSLDSSSADESDFCVQEPGLPLPPIFTCRVAKEKQS